MKFKRQINGSRLAEVRYKSKLLLENKNWKITVDSMGWILFLNNNFDNNNKYIKKILII